MTAAQVYATRPHVACGCGRTYTRQAFAALVFVGVQEVDSEPPSRLALRNCYCGSTIAGDIEVYDREIDAWAIADELPL